MKATEMCATYIVRITPHCLAEQNVVYFYSSLLDNIMYIILNKATFIVI